MRRLPFIYATAKTRRERLGMIIACLVGIVFVLVHFPYVEMMIIGIFDLFLIFKYHRDYSKILNCLIFFVTNECVLLHDFHEELVFYASMRLLGVDLIMFVGELKRNDQRDRIEMIYDSLLCLVASVSTIYLMSYPINHTYRLLIFIPVVVITLLYVVNSIFVKRIVKAMNALHNQQVANHLIQEEYHILNQKYQDVRSLKHDMKNHLQVIAHLSMEKQKSYIEEYIKSMDYDLAFVIPDQPVLEAIINEKYQEAKEKHINFEFYTHTDLSFVDDIDQVTIFGNLLNNAIEANNDGGFITLKIYEKKYFVLIEMKNSISLIQQEKKGHLGIGLSAIKKVSEKYHGSCTFEKGEDYISKIILRKTNSSVK